MSPSVWDLAHIGNYEELWLRAIDGRAAIDPDLDDLYNAFEHPRWERPSLPILGPAETRSYLSTVRGVCSTSSQASTRPTSATRPPAWWPAGSCTAW